MRLLRLRPPSHAGKVPGMRGGASGKGDDMKRLLRWAFNATAAASVVLCLLTCMLWVRSRAAPDVTVVTAWSTVHRIQLAPGSLRYCQARTTEYSATWVSLGGRPTCFECDDRATSFS